MALGNSEGDVKKAAENSADKLNDSYKAALGIKSPSRVMMENGGFVIQGLVKGMEQGENEVTSISDKLANIIPKAFDFLENELYSIGQQAMQGFANGINESGNEAINNANRIANDVADTMKKALDIHSPSRVMMQIGGFIGEGLALGMSKSANRVNDASRLLADASIVQPNSSGGAIIANKSFSDMKIEIPMIVDSREFSRAIVKPFSEELEKHRVKSDYSMGRKF